MPATAISRARSERRRASKDAVFAAAKELWQRWAINVRDDVIAEARAGRPPHLTNALLHQLERDILDVTVTAHLQATLDVFMDTAGALKRRAALKLSLVDDAARFLQHRLAMPEANMERLRQVYGPNSVDVGRQFEASVNKRLTEEMAKSTVAGEHVAAGIDRLRAALHDLGIDEVKDSALETIFRTQTQLGYSSGQWNAYQDPDIQEILWGYEYVTVGDDRVRPEHEDLDGTRLPKDDPRWRHIWPPNGWNCRCDVVEIYDHEPDNIVEPKARMIDGEMVQPKPDKGWDFNPGIVFRDRISLSAQPQEPKKLPATGRRRVLLSLYRLGGSATQVDICKDIKRTKATVSVRINGLVERGLVEHDANTQNPCALSAKGLREAKRLAQCFEI